MTWHLRSPQSFPAHFGRVILEAVAHEGRPVLFGSYRELKLARSVSNDFRQYRWCLRQQPQILPKLSQIESIYQLRLQTDRSYIATDRWFIVYLTAQPTKFTQLVNLNPHLAEIVAGVQ